MTGIYVITCIPTGKKYIGSSKSIPNRWKSHLLELNRGDHHNDYLLKSWKKYGSNNFTFMVLELCDIDIMIEREVYYVDLYKTTLTEYGFNLTNPLKGHNYNEEYRKMQSMKMKGKTPDNIEYLRECQKRGVNLYIYGEFIKTYSSQREASEDLGISHHSINNQLRGRIRYIRGYENYKFEYSDGEGVRICKYNNNSAHGLHKTKILVIDLMSGEEQIFNSIKECSDSIYLSVGTIQKRIKLGSLKDNIKITRYE